MTATIRRPRVATVLGGTAGAMIGMYPGAMPRPVLVDGVVTGMCTLIGIALALIAARVTTRIGSRITGRDAARTPRRAGAPLLLAAAGTAGLVAAWSAQWPMLVGTADGDRTTRLLLVAAIAALTAGTVAAAVTVAVRAGRGGRPLIGLTAVLIAVGTGLTPARVDGPPPAATAPPVWPTRSGGPDSLLDWADHDDHGQRFVTGQADPRAVRIYGGLGAAADDRTRARLVADDLVRAGGLDRAAVVILVPTGSGWVDAALAAAFDDTLGPDIAQVAMAYADAPSWVAYLGGGDGPARATRALIAEVTRRIDALPAARRPELYIAGESLGASAGAQALTALPRSRALLCSALWVGPPARFVDPVPDRSRLVVNPTDPVPRWTPAAAVRPPASGLSGAAPDAAPPWLPGISFLHGTVDVLTARSGRAGTGHVYGVDQIRPDTDCAVAVP